MSGVCSDDEVGVNDGEGPPVPIPNTEVKLTGGENTCLATDREDSTMPTQKQRLRMQPLFFHIRSAWIDHAEKQQYNWIGKSEFSEDVEGSVKIIAQI